MRIERTNMSLSAASAKQQTKTVNEQLNAWVDENGQQEPDFLIDDPQSAYADFIKNSVSKVPGSELPDEFIFEISDEDKLKIQLLTQMIEALTGKKLQFYLPDKFKKTKAELNLTYNRLLTQNQSAQRRAGWGFDYQRHETVTENAQMSFSAKGSVQTADGKTIDINLNLNVSRSFSSEQHLSVKAGDALIDPLVVNYASASAELSAQKYSFDIDSDGNAESISFVKGGSGFLVFDRNKNGWADNGGELFGPSTGSGFLELSAYDGDGNGWIDENDPIYDSLQIWTKDEQGNDRLFAIGQAGIGAIYLGSVASPFELKDEGNALQGQIQRTGVFLKENGAAGTIQHVDLSI